MDYTRTLKFQQASEETDVQADTGMKLTKSMTIPEGTKLSKVCALSYWSSYSYIVFSELFPFNCLRCL